MVNPANFSNKTAAREYAFKFIYRLFLDNFSEEKDVIIAEDAKYIEAIVEFEESYIKEDEEHIGNGLNPSIQNHGQKLIRGFLNEEKAILGTIEKNLNKRALSSIGTIEKAVLSLGTYEIIFEDTPKKVVLNEYINLVKKFGTKESSSFVNGVLDKIQK